MGSQGQEQLHHMVHLMTEAQRLCVCDARGDRGLPTAGPQNPSRYMIQPRLSWVDTWWGLQGVLGRGFHGAAWLGWRDESPGGGRM